MCGKLAEVSASEQYLTNCCSQTAEEHSEKDRHWMVLTAFQEVHGLKALLQYSHFFLYPFTGLYIFTFCLLFLILKISFDSKGCTWVMWLKTYLSEHRGEQSNNGKWGNSSNVPREKETLPNASQKVTCPWMVWHSSSVSGRGPLNCVTYCLEGYGTHRMRAPLGLHMTYWSMCGEGNQRRGMREIKVVLWVRSMEK